MCLSTCGQVGYLVLTSGVFIMALFSLFWPHWYTLNGKNYGFVSSECYDSSKNIELEQCKSDIQNIFDHASSSRTILILMIVGILLTLLSILWCLASFCACCCRSHFLHILPIFSVLAGVVLTGALITFATCYRGQSKLGDSFIIAACSAAVSFIAAVMGGFTAYCSDRCA